MTTPGWPTVEDEALVERMIPAVQQAIMEAVTGTGDRGNDDVIAFSAPDTANVLLMVLALILEQAPSAATPRGMRLVADATGRELAALMRDTRRLRLASEIDAGSQQ